MEICEEYIGENKQIKKLIRRCFFYNPQKQKALLYGSYKAFYEKRDKNNIWHTILEREFKIKTNQKGIIQNAIKIIV